MNWPEALVASAGIICLGAVILVGIVSMSYSQKGGTDDSD